MMEQIYVLGYQERSDDLRGSYLFSNVVMGEERMFNNAPSVSGLVNWISSLIVVVVYLIDFYLGPYLLHIIA